ncbi:hypothetical protein COBT_000537 [Conglomerata obtusa]
MTDLEKILASKDLLHLKKHFERNKIITISDLVRVRYTELDKTGITNVLDRIKVFEIINDLKATKRNAKNVSKMDSPSVRESELKKSFFDESKYCDTNDINCDFPFINDIESENLNNILHKNDTIEKKKFSIHNKDIHNEDAENLIVDYVAKNTYEKNMNNLKFKEDNNRNGTILLDNSNLTGSKKDKEKENHVAADYKNKEQTHSNEDKMIVNDRIINENNIIKHAISINKYHNVIHKDVINKNRNEILYTKQSNNSANNKCTEKSEILENNKNMLLTDLDSVLNDKKNPKPNVQVAEQNEIQHEIFARSGNEILDKTFNDDNEKICSNIYKSYEHKKIDVNKENQFQNDYDRNNIYYNFNQTEQKNNFGKKNAPLTNKLQCFKKVFKKRKEKKLNIEQKNLNDTQMNINIGTELNSTTLNYNKNQILLETMNQHQEKIVSPQKMSLNNNTKEHNQLKIENFVYLAHSDERIVENDIYSAKTSKEIDDDKIKLLHNKNESTKSSISTETNDAKYFFNDCNYSVFDQFYLLLENATKAQTNFMSKDEINYKKKQKTNYKTINKLDNKNDAIRVTSINSGVESFKNIFNTKVANDNPKQENMKPSHGDVTHENNKSKNLKQQEMMTTTRKITVCIRKKPIAEKEIDVIECKENCITIKEIKKRLDLREYIQEHNYTFDYIFDENKKNIEIFESVKNIISHVINGGNGSIIAYGQTGTGKTHTMFHPSNGIVFLSIEEWLKSKENGSISFYEIYNGHAYDLLDFKEEILIREKNGNVVLCNLSSKNFKSIEEGINIIKEGMILRKTGSTAANHESSRSHAILKIHNYENESNSLIFVDLAGSERGSDRKRVNDLVRHEGAEINKSLLALKECIRGMDNLSIHLPFRQSKLTQILKNSLIGNSKTCIIATINSSQNNIEHSLNTIRYADRIKELKNKNRIENNKIMVNNNKVEKNIMEFNNKNNKIIENNIKNNKIIENKNNELIENNYKNNKIIENNNKNNKITEFNNKNNKIIENIFENNFKSEKIDSRFKNKINGTKINEEINYQNGNVTNLNNSFNTFINNSFTTINSSNSHKEIKINEKNLYKNHFRNKKFIFDSSFCEEDTKEETQKSFYSQNNKNEKNTISIVSKKIENQIERINQNIKGSENLKILKVVSESLKELERKIVDLKF